MPDNGTIELSGALNGILDLGGELNGTLSLIGDLSGSLEVPRDGKDATIDVTEITGGHRLTITDVNGTETVDVMDGVDGEDGYSPSVSQTSKSQNWQIPGVISNSRNGFALSVTDANGTTTSPDIYEAWPLKVNATKSGDTTTVKLYTSSSTADATLTIKDGAKGDTGATGATGADGEDGVSPEVTITNITGGHTVTITDADHPSGQSFNVMDGEDGVGIPSGGTSGYVLKKASGTDYDVEWAEESGGKAFYGSCETAADTAAKTASVTGFTSADLVAGTKITLFFKYGIDWAAGITLNVSSTGAKSLELNNDTDFVQLYARSTVDLIYDGTAWNIIGSRATTTSYGYTKLSNSTTYSSQELAASSKAVVDAVAMIPAAATATPSDLGTAAVGSSTKYAKEDHVHKKPTASDIGAYVKPSGGIPATDLANAVQTSLGKADTAYQKPSGGIPAADLASGVIPAVPSAATATPQPTGTEAVGTSAKYAREDHVHAKPTYTAADVGAIAAPSSPSSGQFLVYNGSAWVAQSLSTWQGGSF